MKAHWWSCVLGLLCMPVEVILSTPLVSQEPASISQVRVNSSTLITCSTSLSEPTGVSLNRGFPGTSKSDVVFLDLSNGQITKATTAVGFKGRIRISPEQQISNGVTWQLSLLELGDTDLYYCSWVYYNIEKFAHETLSSHGTIIIVTERGPLEQCENNILGPVTIVLSVAAFFVVLLIVMCTLTVRCKRFKKKFRPARAVRPSRSNRPPHACPQQTIQHCPYLVTSPNPLDFSRIL